MAAPARDGSSHEQSSSSSSHSISSSSSGTIVSTGYDASSSASRLSPVSMEMEVALHSGKGIHVHDDDNVPWWEETEEMKGKRIKVLVQEFFGHSINRGDMSVLGRWLSDLGVGWVLHLAGGASAGELLDHHISDAGSWIVALKEIVQTIDLTDQSLFSDRGPMGICEEEEEEEGHDEAESCMPDQFQLARFFQETMLRMLAFVDAIVALRASGVPALHRKINILLHVRGALSDASSQIELLFISTTSSAQVDRILEEMANLLSVKQEEASEAIWSTLEETRSRILRSMEDAQATQGSSGVHKVTSSVTEHIEFLIHSNNYSTLYPVVTEAASLGKYVPQIGDLPHLDSWVMEMVSCLEGNLAIMSETFSDQGLRFLFLINNSDSVRATLQDSTRYSSLKAHVAALSAKVEGYLQSYLQVSWAPLLSCLFNPQPFCLFGKHCYPLALPKFEAEFHEMYTTQKLWKVPDPELRTNLRIAVIDKIIPGYTKYLENNDVTTPRITSQDLRGMLQELFEG